MKRFTGRTAHGTRQQAGGVDNYIRIKCDYSKKSYQELLLILKKNEPITYDIDLCDDKFYQFEVDCSWENENIKDDILITISIDSGGRSAYHPLIGSVVVNDSDTSSHTGVSSTSGNPSKSWCGLKFGL